MAVIYFDLQRFAGINDENFSSNITFSGTTYADTLTNSGNNVTIQAQDGNDSIVNLAMDPTVTSYSYGKKVLIEAGAGNDTISNSGMYCIIDGGTGDDSIQNTSWGVNSTLTGGVGSDYLTTYNADNVLLDGGADDDSIEVWGNGANISVNGGDGNDFINIENSNVLLTYSANGGNDTVRGYKSNDTLKIDGAFFYKKITSDNNVEISVIDNGSITLLNAGNNTINIIGGNLLGSSINNKLNNKTINGTAGNDIITNDSSNTKIYAGNGNDSVYGGKKNVTIDTGEGNDSVSAWGENISVNGGEGDNYIHFYANAYNTTALAGSGNDVISSGAKTASIFTGAGDDSVHFYANTEENTVDTGDGNDTVESGAKTASISTGMGDDFIHLYANAEEHTIDTGDGKDTVESGAQKASISTGAGDDHIHLYSNAKKNTVNPGTGNDYIQSYETDGVFYQISNNDGYDTINGYTSNDTIGIGGSYSRSTVGSAVVITTQNGSVTLNDAKNKTVKIVKIPIINTASNTAVNGSSSNDTIENSGSNVTVNASAGNDSLSNTTANYVTLNGDTGNDTLRNSNFNSVMLNGGTGKDVIFNSANYVTIDGGTSNDSIVVENAFAYVTTIYGGTGNDTITAYGGLIEGGTGADRISLGNYFASDGVDYGCTINGGTGDDTIYGSSSAGHIYSFEVGDGNDIIHNFKNNDTILLDNDVVYTEETIGSDVVISLVEGGSMTLLNAKGKEISITGGIKKVKGKVIENSTSNTVVNGTANDDTISNTGSNVIIYGNESNDSIYNYADNITISGGTGNDTIYDSFSNRISMSGGAGKDSIYGNNNYATITGGDDDDTIIGNHWRSNIYGDAGSDLISLTTYWYNTIDGGKDNDTIIAGGGEHSVNGGDGNDLISLSGGNLTVDGGSGNDTIYGDSRSSHLYKYTKGNGSDTIFGYNNNDSITVSGGNWSTVTSGNDVILKVDDSKAMTLIDAKDKKLNIYPASNHNPDPTPDVTQQDIIKKFMYSLDNNTNDSGKAALDKAIKYASNGYFTNTDMVIKQMVTDCKDLGKNKFLLNKCGINLSNKDTGAITGSDAGGATIKTAESIIPESGSLDTNFNLASFGTENGLTFRLSKYTLSDDEFYIWRALKTWWADESLNLIKESYDYSFLDKDAPVKEITVVFEYEEGNYLAYTGYPQNINGYYTRKLGINKYYFNNFASNDVNGKSPNGQGYLDRVISHELTHAIMMAKINNFGDLPQFITEGMAELTHGIDDFRGDVIEYLASDSTALKESLSLLPGTGGNYEYASGFMFLRYFAKQSAEHYSPSDLTSKSIITDTSNLKNISVSKGVLTVKKTYIGSTLDLADYSSSIKKVNAKALTGGIMISGNQNANSIVAGVSNDTIFANTGNDTLNGGLGNDILFGEGGNDLIKGEDGADTINGGTGDDTLEGGNGNDTFIFGRNFGKDVITDYTTGKDKIKFATENEVITSSSVSGNNVVLTVNDVDKITIKNAKGKKISIVDFHGKKITAICGSVNNNLIEGSKGSDLLKGDSGNNTLSGGKGNDTLTGGKGKDVFVYTGGKDTITDYASGDKISIGAAISKSTFSDSDAVFTIGKGTLTVKKAKGKKVAFVDAKGKSRTIIGGAQIFTNSSSTKVTLSSGVEVGDASERTKVINLTGNSLANSILGGSGADTLNGGKGNDSLLGGAGNDKLYGQGGADSLWGGAGNDSLYGGKGNDTFIYKPGEGTDRIFDYTAGDMLTILKSNGKSGGSFTSSKYSGGNLTLNITGGGAVIFDSVSKGDQFNINGKTYTLSGTKLK